jgi:hypothetical protein
MTNREKYVKIYFTRLMQTAGKIDMYGLRLKIILIYRTLGDSTAGVQAIKLPLNLLSVCLVSFFSRTFSITC